MKRYLLPIFLLPILASCEGFFAPAVLPLPERGPPIPIWPAERSPFRRSALDFIEPGRTTKQEVRNTLFDELSLNPTSRQDDSGSWWLYRSSHRGAIWLSDEGDRTINDYLIIQFDAEGVVRNYSVLDADRPCDHTRGICFSGYVLFRLADSESDRLAKNFRPDPDQCLLYAFVPRGRMRTSWFLDGQWLIDLLDNELYFRTGLVPGQHTLAASNTSRTDMLHFHSVSEVTFECSPGELLFFRGSPDSVERVEPRGGRRAVRNRSLASESISWFRQQEL